MSSLFWMRKEQYQTCLLCDNRAQNRVGIDVNMYQKDLKGGYIYLCHEHLKCLDDIKNNQLFNCFSFVLRSMR